MDLTLLTSIIVGGFATVFSYAFFYLHTGLTLDDIEGPFDSLGPERTIWLVSVFVTIVAYVAMLIGFVTEQLTEDQKQILYPSYVLFFSCTSQYVLYCSTILYNKVNTGRGTTFFLTLNLWLVALATIGFVVVSTMESHPWWLVLSTGWVAFHHTILDALWWNMKFDVDGKAEEIKLRLASKETVPLRSDI